MRNGKGLYEYALGDFNDGFFQERRRQGEELIVGRMVDKYVGQWKYDKMDGEGEIVSQSGNYRMSRLVNDCIADV